MNTSVPKIPNSAHWRLSVLAVLCLILFGGTGCAGSSVGESMQQSLEADPQLAEQPVLGTTSDRAEDDSTSTTTDQSPEQLYAETDQVAEDSTTPPEAGTPDFIGPMWTPTPPDQSPPGTDKPAVADGERDLLAEVPDDLKPYLTDLIALGLLPVSGEADATSDFQPNQPITRGDYARWLLTLNNQFYADQPAQKIRLALGAEGSAFEDVPTTHPNYEAIQGLAEAGLIPSSLTGNSTAVTFRPDAPSPVPIWCSGRCRWIPVLPCRQPR
jgi:hypothetical protein